MQQLSRVEELDGPQQLPHYVLLVDILQDIGPDDCMQVCLHEVEHQVDVAVILCLVH